MALGWEGARSEQRWTLVDEELITVFNKNAATMQRKCHRLVGQHGLNERMSGEEGRGAAADVYWAAVAALREEGEAMRRGGASSAQRAADDWGQGTLRDQFWLLKLKKSALYDRDGADELAPWRHKKERADAQSELCAGDLLELRWRIRVAGPGHLTVPEAQIHRTGKLINDVLRGFRNVASHRAGTIALTAEISAGRLVTHDGLPSRAGTAEGHWQ